MSTCSEVDSDVHALIKELANRRVEDRSEIHSNESWHLAEGTEVARNRNSTSSAVVLLFYSRHFHSARFIISADRDWCLRAPDSSVRKVRHLYTRNVPR